MGGPERVGGIALTTVLVLGVGGNVSQGILKALACASLPLRVLAGCIDPLSLGLYLADRSFVTPRADDPRFVSWLEGVCAEEGVHAVLSGSEPVLDALAVNAERVREATGAVCLVSPPDVLRVGADKLATARWLAEQGLRSPRTADAADARDVRELVAQCGFPLVAKPRKGKGAQGVATVTSEQELALVTGNPDLVVQEHLEGDEFKAGCLCDSAGEPTGIVTMRRDLREGTTFRAEVADFPEVRAYSEQIAKALGPAGPLNVQLRVVDGEPVAFECNVRFSGTTPLRTRLGFGEVEACLRHFVLGEPMPRCEARPGTVLRYWNEVYVPEVARAELARTGGLREPESHDVSVEDWGMRR